VELFSNGLVIRQATIKAEAAGRAGSKWKHTWVIPRPTHDVHLSAAAIGQSAAFPFHPIARTYQPVTPDWKPYLFGSTGAVRIDGDRDRKWSSPREQASLLADSVEDSIDALLDQLKKYDQAVATQAASVLEERGVDISSKQALLKLKSSPDHVRRGYQAYLDARDRSRRARTAQEG